LQLSSSNRRVVIATDASISLASGFVERYQILMIPRRFRVGKRIVSTAEGPEQFATDRAVPELLPAEPEDFISAYRQASNAVIISIHATALVDNAAQRANQARTLLSPNPEIHVWQAQTFDCGVQLLVQTVGDFVASLGSATPDQALALLERIERETETFLLTNRVGRLPCQPALTFSQQIACWFGTRLTLRLDSAHNTFQQTSLRGLVQSARNQTKDVHVQWRRGNRGQASRYFAEMKQLFGDDGFELHEVSVKNSAFTGSEIGIIAVPNASRIGELTKWVKRWSAATN
jgi:hypothetical protein